MENFISHLTLSEQIKLVNTDLRVNDYVVLDDVTKKNYRLKLNLYYRAEHFCMILVKEGYVKFSANEEMHEIIAGDILFSPPLEIFHIDYTSDDYKAKYIFFSVEFLHQSGFNYKSNEILKLLSGSSSVIIREEPEMFERLKLHINQLENLNDTRNEYYYANELIWFHFSTLIYEIGNHMKKNEITQSVTSREDEITTGFFTLIRDNFQRHHDVQFYADQLFITRKYLSKVIRKTLQKTPRDIISNVLIIEAKILLKDTNANVNQVAEQLSFTDQATFSKFFRKHTGQTPSEYKRSDFF